MTETTKRQQMLEAAQRETWIKTPFSYIKTGSKLSLLQQDAMLMVSAHLQQYIKQFFDLKLNNSDSKPLPLFSQHLLQNGIPPFRIYLANMGIDTANYKVTREAIEQMNLLVEIAVTDEKGKATGATDFVPVFKRFRVPPTGDYYRKTDEQGEIIVETARHCGYIEVEINNEVAQHAFNMAQGYITHPQLIARYATKRSTPRLYFFLQRRMGEKRSATVYSTVQELKEFLGLEPYKDERTGEWVVPYAKFAHFKTKVLDAVQRDMENMARKNLSDIVFTYQPVYKNGRRRGDPDNIEFHIESSRLGLGYNLMTGIDSPAVRVTKEREEQARQLDLFQQQEAEERQRQWYEVWKICQQDLLSQTTNDVSRQRVATLRFESFSEDSHLLTLQCPDRATYQLLELPQIVSSILQPTLEKHFGRGIKLRYRLPKK